MRKRSRILYVMVCLLIILSGCASTREDFYFNDSSMVQNYLNKGGDVNARDKGGSTPLMWMANRGEIEMAKLLIDKGADVNADKDGWTVLMSAVGGGKIEMAKLLIDKGADVNAKDKDGVSLLMSAAKNRKSEMAKLLIDKGADVNGKGEIGKTPLMYAAQGGDIEIVKLLIAKGADINAKANNGSTLLMHAADGGSTEIVNLLIDKGADVSAKDAEGDSVLMYAIPAPAFHSESFLIKDIVQLQYMSGLVRKSANPAVVAKLIEQGADVNTKANDGTTALMLATGIENTETAQLVIKKGADVNAKADDGTTALMLALFYNNMALSNSLRQKGAIIPCNTLITGFPGALNVYVDDEKKTALTFFRDLSDGSHTLRILFLNPGTRQQHGATLSFNAKGNIYIVRCDLRNLKVWVDEISCHD